MKSTSSSSTLLVYVIQMLNHLINRWYCKMLVSKRIILAKILILILCFTFVLYAGFKCAESLLWYKFTSSRNMPVLCTDAQREIMAALKQKAFKEHWENLSSVSIEQVIDVTNKVISDRLEYKYSVSCFDPYEVWRVRKVNCTGYAALQVSMLNFIFKAYGFSWHAEWHCGKVYIGNLALGNMAKVLPGEFGNWQGGHCYTVVYADHDKEKKDPLFPDACFKDLIFTGYLVHKEEN